MGKFFRIMFQTRDKRIAWVMLVMWTLLYTQDVFNGSYGFIPVDLLFAFGNLYAIYGMPERK